MKTTCLELMLICFISVVTAVAAEEDAGTIHIVHMDKYEIPTVFSSHEHRYQSLFSSLKTKKKQEALLYVYDTVMHRFNAKLTQSELDALEKMPGHLASYLDTTGKWLTTHSFKILGLDSKSGIWLQSQFGNRSDVIIGVLDSGIWPESKSFRDIGMSEVPARWKGQCQPGTTFNSSLCNRKLIGARYFNKGFLATFGYIDPSHDSISARDYYGHGSHTSSTAAGNYVADVDYFDYTKGTARGMAPRARLAMYKIRWYTNATFPGGFVAGSDVLAAMETAIADGVDVLSLSLKLRPEEVFFKNPVALGAFAATEKGVLVSCAARNDGLKGSTVLNGAPWILTVGANTIDRVFVAKIKLGNGKLIEGTSFFVERKLISGFLVFYGGNASSRKCAPGSLDPESVARKILLCSQNDSMDSYLQILESNRTRAAGVIMAYEDHSSAALLPPSYWMPAVSITSDQGRLIADYIKTAEGNAKVGIEFVITRLGFRPAPAVAGFSSRGPYFLSLGIVKPDVIAPDVNILAATLPYSNVTYIGSAPLEANYTVFSGTSMGSPHAVGVAALVKSVHLHWSPAAIRSALITTSYRVDNTGLAIKDEGDSRFGPVNPLDFGAGHLNPNNAVDRGLVYDSRVNEYLDYLCALNYMKKEIRLLSRREYSCSSAHRSIGDLNHPLFFADFRNGIGSFLKIFNRILSNVVGIKRSGSSVYREIVTAPPGVSVKVEPHFLVFKKRNEKLGFSLSMKPRNVKRGCLKSGYLSWDDGKGHVVSSPLVASFS